MGRGLVDSECKRKIQKLQFYTELKVTMQTNCDKLFRALQRKQIEPEFR